MLIPVRMHLQSQLLEEGLGCLWVTHLLQTFQDDMVRRSIELVYQKSLGKL